MTDIFKGFLELYVHVFKSYTLAASLTTLIFGVAYIFLNEKNKKRQSSASFWEKPEFIVIVAWLIVTPMLGFVFSLFGIVKDVLFYVAGIYAQLFKNNPEAGAIITVILLGVYFIWKTILRRWATRATGFWSYPAAVLVTVWLLATPILGLVIKAHMSPKEQDSKQAKQQPAQSKLESDKAQDHK